MAAAAAVATATEIPRIGFLHTNHLSLKTPMNKVMGTANFAFGIPNSFSTLRIRRSFLAARASNSNSNTEDDNPTIDNTNASFISKEDLNYFLKLGAGTFAGAAVIKYGSAIFPEITRPDIFQALIMIFGPVVVAIFLLIRQSRVEQR